METNYTIIDGTYRATLGEVRAGRKTDAITPKGGNRYDAR